jgi:hypothetical protein
MDGLGNSHCQLFYLDLYGHQGRRYAKGFDGSHVLVVGFKSHLELASIKKLINSTILARSTAVDVFGKNAII